MTDHTRIIDKIRKCLALAASSNPHEAANALRQAQTLMRQHQIDQRDIDAARARERATQAGVRQRPPKWEARLASVIASAFSCRSIFAPGGWNSRRGQWRFIGVDANPDIASYAMDVLLRQAKTARTLYVANLHHRCARDTKTRHADLFCAGWVSEATAKIRHFAGENADQPAINAYIDQHYPELRTLKPTDRLSETEPTAQELRAFGAGLMAGQSAQLNRSMQHTGRDTPALPI